jgi:hypothetical protein
MTTPMDKPILTYSELWDLVNIDTKDHKLKDIAILFLAAMNDWQTMNQERIAEFIKEVKSYFGTPLTIQKLNNTSFDGQNAWQLEAGSSIVKVIDVSTKFYNQPDFDKIVENILNYYSSLLTQENNIDKC